MFFQYCPGPGRSVEKDKLEHVTHLTNYSKLFDRRFEETKNHFLFYFAGEEKKTDYD